MATAVCRIQRIPILNTNSGVHETLATIFTAAAESR
jgi:hypothetical protein